MSDRDLRPDSTTHLIRETCHAPHPDPLRRDDKCGTLLGYFPVQTESAELELVATSNQAPNPHHLHARNVVIRCSRRTCHRWNVFEMREPPK